MDRTGKIRIITILIAVSAIILASVNSYNIIDRGNTAYIWGEVQSLHETEPVDVIVYVDGVEVRWYEGLEPGEIFTFMWMCEFPFFDRSKSVEVKTVCTGGSEPHSDSEFLSVKDLKLYRIELHV
jgi:hypothetical protein